MISSWRRRRAARRGGLELTIPSHFKCPISLDVMKDPVTLTTAITYDRESIEKWIESGNHTCPITNQVLKNLEPVPNHAIRKMIQTWCEENKSHGIQRIPTPRIPITSYEASEILLKLRVASRQGDVGGCLEAVEKIRSWMAESERNRRCVAACGAGRTLSEAFGAFSEGYFGKNSVVLGEILSALTMIFPLDDEAKSHLWKSQSLDSMAWFLKCGDLRGRRNTVLVMREIIMSSSRQENIIALVEIEGVLEALFKLVKSPICPKTTKASLTIIYYIVGSSSSIKQRLIDMGMVFLLLETLADAEKGMCERALGVLDGLCDCDQGREKALAHALTVPVLVKKLLRVSELATEFSVSVLWKLCQSEKRGEGERGALVEALQVGAFQKLLLLLQVGCGEETKDRASEVLKMLNVHRDRVECIDSMDFKDLKRPF